MNDERTQRGPAPVETEGEPCDPTPERRQGEKPACPEGYPDDPNTPQQQPSTDAPRPKPRPTKQGD